MSGFFKRPIIARNKNSGAIIHKLNLERTFLKFIMFTLLFFIIIMYSYEFLTKQSLSTSPLISNLSNINKTEITSQNKYINNFNTINSVNAFKINKFSLRNTNSDKYNKENLSYNDVTSSVKNHTLNCDNGAGKGIEASKFSNCSFTKVDKKADKLKSLYSSAKVASKSTNSPTPSSSKPTVAEKSKSVEISNKPTSFDTTETDKKIYKSISSENTKNPLSILKKTGKVTVNTETSYNYSVRPTYEKETSNPSFKDKKIELSTAPKNLSDTPPNLFVTQKPQHNVSTYVKDSSLEKNNVLGAISHYEYAQNNTKDNLSTDKNNVFYNTNVFKSQEQGLKNKNYLIPSPVNVDSKNNKQLFSGLKWKRNSAARTFTNKDNIKPVRKVVYNGVRKFTTPTPVHRKSVGSLPKNSGNLLKNKPTLVVYKKDAYSRYELHSLRNGYNASMAKISNGKSPNILSKSYKHKRKPDNVNIPLQGCLAYSSQENTQEAETASKSPATGSFKQASPVHNRYNLFRNLKYIYPLRESKSGLADVSDKCKKNKSGNCVMSVSEFSTENGHSDKLSTTSPNSQIVKVISVRGDKISKKAKSRGSNLTAQDVLDVSTQSTNDDNKKLNSTNASGIQVINMQKLLDTAKNSSAGLKADGNDTDAYETKKNVILSAINDSVNSAASSDAAGNTTKAAVKNPSSIIIIDQGGDDGNAKIDPELLASLIVEMNKNNKNTSQNGQTIPTVNSGTEFSTPINVTPSLAATSTIRITNTPSRETITVSDKTPINGTITQLPAPGISTNIPVSAGSTQIANTPTITISNTSSPSRIAQTSTPKQSDNNTNTTFPSVIIALVPSSDYAKKTQQNGGNNSTKNNSATTDSNDDKGEAQKKSAEKSNKDDTESNSTTNKSGANDDKNEAKENSTPSLGGVIVSSATGDTEAKLSKMKNTSSSKGKDLSTSDS